MTSFATVQDMEERSQGAITAATHPFLQKELDAATETIRNHCRWHIAPLKNVDLVRRFSCVETVWLPAMRVSAVVSATLDGMELDPDALTEVEFDPLTGWTSLEGRSVAVTFTAGFDPTPSDIVQLCLELTAGGLGSPLGIQREQAGSVSVMLSRTSGALSEDDMMRLSAYRLGVLP